MPSWRLPKRRLGMTRSQTDVAIRSALALGFDSAIAENTTRTRFKLVLTRKAGDGAVRLCAWTWADWVAICREEAEHELPF